MTHHLTNPLVQLREETAQENSDKRLGALAEAIEGILDANTRDETAPSLELAKIQLLQHINVLLSHVEAREKLAFGDHLIVYFSSLPCRLLAEATKNMACLVPNYQLIATGDRLILSLKQRWRNRLRNLFTVPDKWFVRLKYSPTLSDGLPNISSVEFDRAVTVFL